MIKTSLLLQTLPPVQCPRLVTCKNSSTSPKISDIALNSDLYLIESLADYYNKICDYQRMLLECKCA